MNYLRATYYFDYESPEIQELVADFKSYNHNPKKQAQLLYLKIRDHWRYNPYTLSFTKEGYIASSIAQKSTGHCVDKSILFIACLRALGIPSRIHLAKVKNHIAVERLTQKFGSNELTPHGMVDLYLDGKWIKVSPAFDKALCHLCKVAPLDFDGAQDSVFQEYNNEGNLFMEYLEDYGHFEDVPLDFIFNNVKEHYPDIYQKHKGQATFTL